MSLGEREPAFIPAQWVELVADLKHDLAKAVAWRSANVAPEGWGPPLRDEALAALRADVLHTRRSGPPGAEVSEPAWEVWARLMAGRSRPWPAELDDVERAVGELSAAAPLLAVATHELPDAAALERTVAAIRAAQTTIRAQLRELHARLRRELADEPERHEG
jgi:hypothetical protein